MSAYSILVFLHVIAALGIFAALAIEWTSLSQLRHARSIGMVREWLRPIRALRFLGGPALLVLLVTGLAMLPHWRGQAWVGLGLVGLILMGILGGGVSGRRLRTLGRAIPSDGGTMPPVLSAQLRDPVLLQSAWLRTGVGVGVVFLMTVKPGPVIAVITLSVSMLLGAAASLAGRSRQPAGTAHAAQE